MQLKDYYKTLEITPTATQQQVKRSFRQLAHRYHPDKNPGNQVAEAFFREIQEAYETLADPEKRAEYNYKRWYSRSLHQLFSEAPLSPESILEECRRLNRYLQTTNLLQLDFDGLSYHIRQLLSNRNIGILQQSADNNTITRVVESLLGSAAVLPSKYTDPITGLLLQLTGNDTALAAKLYAFGREQKQKDSWQKYRLVIVLIVTGLICLLIYRVSK